VPSLEALIQAVLNNNTKEIEEAVKSLDCVLLVLRTDTARDPVTTQQRPIQLELNSNKERDKSR
jgi:hypothetical protein